jgi:hypothetical protein
VSYDNDQLAFVQDLREVQMRTGIGPGAHVQDAILWEHAWEMVRRKGWTRNLESRVVYSSEEPLRFAEWLRTERSVIGEDVNLDVLLAQYRDEQEEA